LDNIGRTKLFRATYLGVPLIAGGLIEKHEDDKFRSLRNDFMPLFHRPLDNYTQYLPAAVMLGMKAAGVKGRSSWGRMLLSDLFSASIMGITVNTLKTTTNVTRPDGSNNHSFPSGHTAMAFMAATMLNKEYGDMSPLIGVGAYGVATATGLMRMANNKHWLSDVMVGAGIGILSTEFGYWLADAICKDRGLEREPKIDVVDNFNPTFLGMYMGFNLPLSHYDITNNIHFDTSTGTTIGLEGAYFLNKYIGFGGRTSISRVSLIVNGEAESNNSFTYGSFYGGPYFSVPLTPRWNVMTKLLTGYIRYRHNDVNGYHIKGNGKFSAGTGLSLGYHVKKRLGADIFLDYNVIPPHSNNSGEYMHIMTLGGKVSYRL
jgi:membrane-associated phospholipid phosphatase